MELGVRIAPCCRHKAARTAALHLLANASRYCSGLVVDNFVVKREMSGRKEKGIDGRPDKNKRHFRGRVMSNELGCLRFGYFLRSITVDTAARGWRSHDFTVSD